MTTVGPETGGRRRWLTAGVAAVILVTVGWLVLGTQAGPVAVVEVPAPGNVVADQLVDGTPVWVSQDTQGHVAVIEALTPLAGPIRGLVGWCDQGQRFVDPHMGLTFASDGSRYNGFVPGRTRPDQGTVGLTPRARQIAGKAEPGDPILVAEPTDPATERVDPPLRGELAHGPPLGCRRPDRRIGGTDPASLTGLTDHASRRHALDTSLQGWQIADGWLQFRPDGTAHWCEGQLTDRGDSTCQTGGAVQVMITVPPAATAAIVTALGDPLAVQVDASGSIVSAAVLPTSTWAGSSLQPTVNSRVDYLGTDATGSRLLVRAPSPQRCVSDAPAILAASPGTSVIYIDSDTQIDIQGSTTPDDLRNLGVLAAGIAADVVMDGATCRALAVRDPG